MFEIIQYYLTDIRFVTRPEFNFCNAANAETNCKLDVKCVRRQF